jgi:hypothetical protein
MNGQILNVDITDDSGANIFFNAPKKNGKMKSFSLYKTDIFSVTKKGQAESVLYVKDEPMGNEYSVPEMRYFLHGENDARKGFRTWPTAVGGVIYGAAGTMVMGRSLIPFALFPVTYSLGMQLPVIKIRKETISNTDFPSQPTYKEGYNKVARSKKFIKSFVYTFAGVAIGTAAIELTD